MAMTHGGRVAGGGGTSLLVTLAVVATAFNDLTPILPVGELSNDAFIYVFPLLVLAILRRPSEITVPTGLFLVVLALIASLIAGVGANWAEISSAYFKGRSGASRVVTQGMAMAFGLIVTLVFYNIARAGHVRPVMRGARIAIVVMAVVGVLEVGSWYGVPLLTQLHEAVAGVVHGNSGDTYVPRLRTTAFEVSWAAVMLTFLFPFAIMDAPPGSWRFAGILATVLVLVLLAQSRTALLVIGIQMMFLAALLLRRRIDVAFRALAAGCLFAIAVLLTPGTGDRVTEALGNMVQYGSFGEPQQSYAENVSNVTRLAAIRSGLSMFVERPMLGVGLGQYGFNYPDHLRAEDFRSWEVRQYVTEEGGVWPPSYSIHVRLLAETGIIGYGLWLAIVLPLFGRSILRAGVATQEGCIHLATAMVLLGWLLLGTSIDSFRFFGGWIALGVASGMAARTARAEPVAAGRGAPARGSPA